MHMGSNCVCALRRAREAASTVRSGSGLLLPQKCKGSAEELMG